MQWQCLVFFVSFTVIAVRSASIAKQDIPVQVLYEKAQDKENRNSASVRNLDERVQLSSEELKRAEVEEKYPIRGNLNAIRNLDAKVQLSHEELNVAVKHLPEANQELKENEIPQDIKLKIVTPDVVEKSSEGSSGNEDNLLFERIQEIINNGVQNIKQNIKASDGGKAVKPEVWKKLDKDVENFLKDVRERNSLKQTQNPNLFQQIADQFQNFTNNFVSTFTPPNQQNDENQKPGFGQNIVNLFTNGFQQIQTGLSSLSPGTQNSTVLGDPETSSTAPGNPFQGFVTQVQNVFSGQTNPLEVINTFNPFSQQTQAPGTQGDDTTTPGGPIQSIQNAFSQFGQTINNFNPFTQATQAPATQGDEQTTPSGPLQFVQGLGNQVGQVFNNFNPFLQQPASTKAPAQADSTNNPLQEAAENVGGQITQVNPGQALQGLVEQVAANNPLQGGSNPAAALQGVGQQVAGAITSNNPLQGGSNPLQGVAEQVGSAISSNNPLQGGSNPLEQVSSAINSNNPLQGGSNPLEQVSSAINSNNPLQGGSNPLQGIGEQVSSAISSSNPLQGGSNPLQGIGEQVTGALGSNPLQEIGNQVGGAINSNSPLQGGSNPLQGIGNQVSGAINANNPFQSDPNPLEAISSNNPLQGVGEQVTGALGSSNPQESGGQALQGLINQVSAADYNRGEATPAAALLRDIPSEHGAESESQGPVGAATCDNKKKEGATDASAGDEQEKPVQELLLASE